MHSFMLFWVLSLIDKLFNSFLKWNLFSCVLKLDETTLRHDKETYTHV